MQVLNYHLRRYSKPSYKEVEVLTRLSEMLVKEEARKKILELLEEANATTRTTRTCSNKV